MLRLLPNIITILRIILVPVNLFLLLNEYYISAFMLFSLLVLSDILDGFLARYLDAQTALGSYLDPLADKFLFVSFYITFGIFGWVPLWLVLMIIGRDILIIFGVTVSYMRSVELKMSPLLISKINTGMQSLLGVYVLLKESFMFGFDVSIYLFTATALTTLISGLVYIFLWLRSGLFALKG